MRMLSSLWTFAIRVCVKAFFCVTRAIYKLDIRNARNRTCRTCMWRVKAQTSRCISEVSTGHSQFVGRFCSVHWFCKRTTKALIRLKRCVHLSRNVRKRTFEYMCVPSEDSDQSAHLHCLMRIFTGLIFDSQGCKVSSNAQRRL